MDLDAIDDTAHGHQQLTFWHGYYDQKQYLPLAITCADNDQFVILSLRPGNVHAALGADDDLEYLVTRLRRAWPDVVLIVRGDASFGVPWMYDVCERLRLLYTFGLSSNAVLQRLSDELLTRAVAGWEQEQQAARREDRPALPQRLFTGFWYQAASWPQPRWVIAKAEAHAQGTNRRFVVSNRPGAPLLAKATYDEYAQRGESENRNKELKCGVGMDRLSDHRFVANLFRMYLHAAALNLLVRLRREIADPPAAGEAEAATLTGAERKRHQNARRRRAPLGEGHPPGLTDLTVFLDLGRATPFDPKNLALRAARGRLLLQLIPKWGLSWPEYQAKLPLAREELEAARKQSHCSAELFDDLGLVAERMGEYKGALDSY